MSDEFLRKKFYHDTMREFCKQELKIQLSLLMDYKIIPHRKTLNKNKIGLKIFTKYDESKPNRTSMAYKEYGVNKIPFIELDLKYAAYDHRSYRLVHLEYDDWARDPIIGNISGNWKTYCSVLVAHELSHLVDFYHRNYLLKQFLYMKKDIDYSNHGSFWALVYGFLRTIRVNRIEDRITLFDLWKEKINGY